MQITLRSARINANLSQEQLANNIGVHRNTIAKWENNPSEMSIGNAEKVCKALNVKLSDIFFGSTLHNVD